MLTYVDTTSDNDFDKVVRYFLDHDIVITHRDKLELVVGGEVTEEFLRKMVEEVEFEGSLVWGDKPLSFD